MKRLHMLIATGVAILLLVIAIPTVVILTLNNKSSSSKSSAGGRDNSDVGNSNDGSSVDSDDSGPPPIIVLKSISCPDPSQSSSGNDSSSSFAAEEVYSNTTEASVEFTIPIVAADDTLCMLWRITTTADSSTAASDAGASPKTDRVAVGRSYNGHDWETYSNRIAEGSSFRCSHSGNTVSAINSDSAKCSIMLRHDTIASSSAAAAAATTITTVKYELVSTTYDSLEETSQMARFMEQATFGTTTTELNQDLKSVSNIPNWIHDQMYNPAAVKPGYHRAYYRARLNHRKTLSTLESIPTHPCQVGTRYRKYAFTDKDRTRFLQIVTRDSKKYIYTIGFPDRTASADQPPNANALKVVLPYATIHYGNRITNNNRNTIGEVVPDGIYEVCFARDNRIGGRFTISSGPGRCSPIVTTEGEDIDNPAVTYDANDPNDIRPLLRLNNANARPIDEQFYNNQDGPQEIVVTQALTNAQCTNGAIPSLTNAHKTFDVVASFRNEFYIHDPRWNVHENTLSNPDSGTDVLQIISDELEKNVPQSTLGLASRQMVCSNVPMNFVNERDCMLVDDVDDSCTPADDISSLQSGGGRGGGGDSIVTTIVPLTRDIMKGVYDFTRGATIIYSVTGLRQGEYSGPNTVPPPCSPSTVSRWQRLDNSNSCNQGSPGTTTIGTFRTLIRGATSNDATTDVFDVFTQAIGTICDSSDVQSYNFQVQVNGDCYQNVHPNEGQVFDFSAWVNEHPGGRPQILQFSMGNNAPFQLSFPSNHGMDRWENNGGRRNIGKRGDTVAMQLSRSMAESLGTEIVDDIDPSSALALRRGVMCGSPNEVASDWTLGGSAGGRGSFDAVTFRGQTASNANLEDQIINIWMNQALYSPDQLRQRVAWALAQLLVISPDAVAATGRRMTETFLAYTDIFLRHAFGNYRDVLKEVAFSPLMGEMLSYVNSKSTAYIWQQEKRLEYADENFAREVMQLFSIGLHQMHTNGTRVLAEDSDAFVRTYTNDEISEYAKIYTGFVPRERRGNVEDKMPQSNMNPIDPMKLDIATHDLMPKLGLNRWYVGDGLPLCSALDTTQHFLKAGATYRLLGKHPYPQMLNEPMAWSMTESARDAVTRLNVGAGSPLYDKLCNANGGSCSFKGVVALTEDIACGTNTGDTGLCSVKAPRVLEIGSTGVFYEYVQPPCSRLSFYDDGKVMRTHANQFYCEDPTAVEGATSCCQTNGAVQTFQEFSGERVSFADAVATCEANSLSVCNELPTDCAVSNSCDSSIGRWTRGACSVQAKIDVEGRVALVHSLPVQVPEGGIHQNIRQDTKSFFRVEWAGSTQDDGANAPIADFLADYEAQCDTLGCGRDSSDNLCLCATKRVDSQAIPQGASPTIDEIVKLHIGAFEFQIANGMVTTNLGNGVKMHATDQTITKDSIFEVMDQNGIKQLRRNIRSTVQVGNNNGDASLLLEFRNAPHMISLTHPEQRDVNNEIDAALDHYFYHPNMAPFLSYRMAQRFGISNPSPRYVETMSLAFRSGKYAHADSGRTYGSSKYGDMGALVAAMLLDRETRSYVLDKDPTHGSMFEPFLRYLKLMRSLQFEMKEQTPDISFSRDLQSLIGQEPYQLPSVFSFFLPELLLKDDFGTTDLACPECQALTGPKVIALMNGMLSLLKFGFDGVYGGFGPQTGREEQRAIGNFERFARGHNMFLPAQAAGDAATIVNELSMLLTSGRLNDAKLAMLKQIYESTMAESDDAQMALINVQQAIITSPEFHTNTLSENKNDQRPSPEPPQSSSKKYKAVVYLLLEGGYDSFNMLVPHTCSGDLVQQYHDQRGAVGLTDAERDLVVNAATSGQPCTEFALHPELPIVKEMYDDGHLAFFANTGVFANAKMDKSNYFGYTPIQLFAHNSMQREAKTIDVFSEVSGSGVLGRLSDVLTAKDYRTNSVTIDNPTEAVESASDGQAPDPIIVSRFGAQSFNRRPDDETFDVHSAAGKSMNSLSGEYSSIFGEAWSDAFLKGVDEAEQIKAQLESASLGDHWPDTDVEELTQKLSIVSRMIQTHEQRGTDRDLFFVGLGGWDHHRLVKENLQIKFSALNAALATFAQELKIQERFEDVTTVVASEFARTITPNSGGGTDHAWGGHYMMFGGSVKGGQVYGTYPDNITPEGSLNIGRGRILPTTSWDCVWNSVCQWMGVDQEEELDMCLPNRANVVGVDGYTDLFSEGDLFQSPTRRLRRHG